MADIFLSYRRHDSQSATGRLSDRLAAHFGPARVFLDHESIAAGDDFAEAIRRAVGTSVVLLAIVGPDWLTACDANGKRRLDDEGDFVRLEIESALLGGVPVIPVLVGGALMPAEADLPPALAGLARRQAVVLSDAGWRGDVERLVTTLRDLLPGIGNRKSETRSGWLILAGVALLVLLAVFAAEHFLAEKAAATRQQSALEIAGRWTARVKYAWGDEHQEVFEFKILGKQVHGSATYLSSRLTIERVSLEDGWLRFITRSRESLGGDSLGKVVTHRYTGQVTPEGIRFTLESGGGYTLNPPLEFVATRASP